jgi:hypothetical protein
VYHLLITFIGTEHQFGATELTSLVVGRHRLLLLHLEMLSSGVGIMLVVFPLLSRFIPWLWGLTDVWVFLLCNS